MNKECDVKVEIVRTHHLETSRPPQSWQSGKNHLKALIQDPWYTHLAKVSATIHSATIKYFEAQGLSNLAVPVTTASVSSPMGLGSDSLPVRIQIDGKQVYLADSLQFLLELGLRIASRPQYYISNSFRGEEVDRTHLSEFFHSEVEIFGGLEDIMKFAEGYVTFLSRSLLENDSETIMAVVGKLDHLRDVAERTSPFRRITFSEAQTILADVPGAFEHVAPDIPSITRKGEQLLMHRLGAPVWLTHMPAMACPFYQRPLGDGIYCASADLLFGPGEILGAGARCVNADEVCASLSRHEVPKESYGWYVEMKDMTPMETAGFGLGLERFYMWAMQTNDIRDCTLWIRRNGEVVGP